MIKDEKRKAEEYLAMLAERMKEHGVIMTSILSAGFFGLITIFS